MKYAIIGCVCLKKSEPILRRTLKTNAGDLRKRVFRKIFRHSVQLTDF